MFDEPDRDGRPAPPPSVRIDTGGGAIIIGNVDTGGGDFVGRDSGAHRRDAPAAGRPSRGPALPSNGEPLGLLIQALRARRLLLVWGDVPFAPAGRPPANVAVTIADWQAQAETLLAIGLPLSALPPLPILSLDPTGRLEAAFRAAEVQPQVVRTRRDVPAQGRRNLLKFGGDLASRSGLLLSWDDVRAAASDPTKSHLLREAARAAEGGAALVLAPAPTDAFARIWRELVAPWLTAAAHHFALGPAEFNWPPPLQHVPQDPAAVLGELAKVEVEPAAAGASIASDTDLLRSMDSKLRQLLNDHAGLRQGQLAIYQRLTDAQRETVDEVLVVVRQAQLEDAETARELKGIADGIRRALIHLQSQQLPEFDSGLRDYVDEIVMILKSDTDLRSCLELSLPIIPAILKYKTTLEVGPGVDLRQWFRELLAWARVRYDRGGAGEPDEG